MESGENGVVGGGVEILGQGNATGLESRRYFTVRDFIHDVSQRSAVARIPPGHFLSPALRQILPYNNLIYNLLHVGGRVAGWAVGGVGLGWEVFEVAARASNQ